MNNPMYPGWGPCGLCGRQLALMTPVTSVILPHNKQPVMTCKDCPDRREKLEKVGLKVEPEVESHPVVVSDPAVFAASSLKVTEEKKPAEPEPSKPVKEQTGTRRRKKAKDEEEAPVQPDEGDPGVDGEGRSGSGDGPLDAGADGSE